MGEEFESSGNWWDASRSIPSSSTGDPNLQNWNQAVLNLSTQETDQQRRQNEWMIRSEKLYSSGESPDATDQFKRPLNRGFSFEHQNQPQPQFSSSLYGNYNSATLLFDQGLLRGEQHEEQQQQQKQHQGMNFPYSAHFGEFLTNSAPPPHTAELWNNASSVIKHDVVPPSNSFPPFPHNSILNISEVGDVGKKSGNNQNQQSGAAAAVKTKRPRNETPSLLPAFKVRKEKMGDRITALQQLVSPFGKTDTASVLSEAIEYIKFLHEQVSVLSTPYLNSGSAVQQQHQQRSYEKTKEVGEGEKQDLRSRGLCLVPISSTFSVTHETTVDFWTPNFAGTFT